MSCCCVHDQFLLLQGGAGDKVMFYFFFINCAITALTYYKMSTSVDQPMRHLAFCAALFGTIFFILVTYLSDPGTIPNTGEPNKRYLQALELAADGACHI